MMLTDWMGGLGAPLRTGHVHDLRAELLGLLGDVSLWSPATIIGAPCPAPSSLLKLTSHPLVSLLPPSPTQQRTPSSCSATEVLWSRGRECNNRSCVTRATSFRWRHSDAYTSTNSQTHQTEICMENNSHTVELRRPALICGVALLASMRRADPSLL